jgi:hypothetical protein
MVRFLLQPTRPLVSKLTPAQAASALFLAMFGMMFLIRTLVERRFYFTRFKSFLIGDSIGFPLFGLLAARLLQGYSAEDHWFDRRLTQIVLLAFFTLAGEWNYQQGIKTGVMEDWRRNAPSERYHSTAFGPVGALITHAGLSILLGTKAKKRDKAIALSPLLLWIGGVMWDIIRLPKA